MNSPNQSIYSMTHSGSIYKLSEKSNGRKPTRFRRKISFFGKFINGTLKYFSDRVISSNLVEYSVEDDCYKINDLAAAKFLGHSTRDFILESTYDKFNPSWVQAQLREDISPK